MKKNATPKNQKNVTDKPIARTILISVKRYGKDGKVGAWTRPIKVVGDPQKQVERMQLDPKVHAVCVGYEDSKARRLYTRGWVETKVGA